MTHYLNGECKWHYFWLLQDFKKTKQNTTNKQKNTQHVTATEKCEAEYNTINYLIFKSKETYSKYS